MAITDYQSLKDTLADYLHRTDLSDAVLSNFVDFGEKRMNRKLRLLQQEKTTTLQLPQGANTVALPSDWLQTIDLIHAGDKDAITPASVSDLNAQTGVDQSQGRPRLYATTNGFNLVFDVFADQNYSLQLNYFDRWDIAADNVNWLLLNAPDAYLYASLLEAKAYTKKPGDLSLWAQGLEAAMSDLSRTDNRTRRNARARVGSAVVRAGRFNIYRGY